MLLGGNEYDPAHLGLTEKAMDVVLDTSILRKHLSLQGKSIELLLDYVTKTNSKVLLPAIVIDEAAEVFRRELLDRMKKHADAVRALRAIPTRIPLVTDVEVDVDEQVTRYKAYVHDQLHLSPVDVLQYKNDYLPDLVARAVKRRAPMSSDGQQFRDALLWLTILDYARKHQDHRLALISLNTRDFANGSTSGLCEDLRMEAEQYGVSILYYASLEDFVKAQASRLDFVNDAWLDENFNVSEVEKMVYPRIENRAIDRLTDDLVLVGRDRRVGHFEETGFTSSYIDEYYVYEKQDGTLVLNVDMMMEVEFAVLIERERDSDATEWEFYSVTTVNGEEDYDIRPTQHSIEDSQRREYRTVEVRVQVASTIVDKALQGYEIVGWDWA